MKQIIFSLSLKDMLNFEKEPLKHCSDFLELNVQNLLSLGASTLEHSIREVGDAIQDFIAGSERFTLFKIEAQGSVIFL